MKHLIAWMVFCLGVTSVEAAEVPAKDRMVILVSLDGFPAWMWNDPALPCPNLRKLAKEGSVAEAMTVSNPSITWINHTTMITGVEPRKHGVLFNGLLVRNGDLAPKVEPWRNREEMVFVPTLYDATTAAGLTSAEVDWVAVTNPKTITWSFPELPTADNTIVQELVSAGEMTEEQIGWFKTKNPSWRDIIWTKAACHLLTTRKPNLLMFHLLNTDAVNHSHGPGSYGSFTAYAFADRLLGDLLDAVKHAGRTDKTTFVITTDHGFKKVKKVIHPNVAIRKAGLLRANGNVATSCEAYAMTQGGMAFVYVLDPNKKATLLPKLKELCAALEGVGVVADGSDGPKYGMPTPKENQGMGDLILFAKDSYAFQATIDSEQDVAPTTTYLGTHGYSNAEPDLDGIFIASGYGIAAGKTLPRVRNLDIAPTIARLLNLEMPEMDGRVLNEFLK